MRRRALESNSTSGDDLVSDFLAAPDEVAKNPRERAKLVQRKAQDDARRERELATKSGEVPTQEDLLADIVRVAEDENTNPFHKFRSISPRRYELYGHYPLEWVTRQFGYFQHAKQQAGLVETVGDRTFKRVRTTESLREHDARYMSRYMLPHVDKFPELRRQESGEKVVLVISDMHGLYSDPFTWLAFCELAEAVQPDVVDLNGDIIDALGISSHGKPYGAGVPLQLEFDFVRGIFTELRRRLGNRTRLVWGAGNHGLDRLARYLSQVSPAIAGLRNLRFDQLAGLGDLEVELVQGGTFVSPKGTEMDEPRKKLWDTYLVTHGTKLGVHPAYNELRQWGCSGTSGHVHRAELKYGSTAALRRLSWMSTPMGCIEDAGRHYIKDHAGWQKGFGIAFIRNGLVHQYPIITDGGWCCAEGWTFEKRDLPSREDDVLKWWVERYNLEV